jgi:hypothetical protein
VPPRERGAEAHRRTARAVRLRAAELRRPPSLREHAAAAVEERERERDRAAVRAVSELERDRVDVAGLSDAMSTRAEPDRRSPRRLVI